MQRCPLSLPLSKSYGARPTRAAICLRLIWPSSGNNATRVKASVGPTPCLEVGGLVFDRDMLVAKLSPHGDDLGELLCGRIALHDPCWHDRNVFCDQPRIEAVVLGKHATGAAELAQLVGVDASHRQVRR